MGEENNEANRSSRFLRRAVFVLGATAVATATAWLISSASASADQLTNGTSGVMPNVGDPAVSSTLRSAEEHAAPNMPNMSSFGRLHQGMVEPIPANLATPSMTPPAGWDHLTGQLGSTMTRLQHIDAGLPVSKAATDGLRPVLGGTDTNAVHPLTPLPIHTVAGDPVAVPEVATRPIVVDQHTSEINPLGQHRTTGGRSDLPGVPSSQTPLTVPATPSPGNSGNGPQGPNGPSLGDASALPISPGFDLVSVLTPTTAPVRVLAGKQPGTTPD